ncbi:MULTISPECIES: hypothetical protein [Bacillus]|nr:MULTISPECIES: hypothetical protein [Bacillus cereus group]KZE08308.1 hypothetical protein B4117_0106 [Bacillus mycoides]MBJ8018551.1 hypothetical protein [Bacillus cereus group sp. N34]QWI72506.1 hypothetical protein ER45_012350 [Bacillus mycoides]
MESSKAIVWINVFNAKPGKLDELVAIQAEELLNFKRKGAASEQKKSFIW